MKTSLLILAEHAARTLPDSLTDRQRVVRALAHLFNTTHPATPALRAQLAALDAAARLAAELPQHFSRGDNS